MDTNTIYAIVDIETTGTSVADGNRIIQFGCVLVQNGRIINKFATDVNPQQQIPEPIKALTGISDEQVKHAPLFDDVAGTIYSLLTGTVFVAHNVNFDFPFVNAELERVGYPTLPIEAIDTVTLSQILLPTVDSYRLHDLSSYLSIRHDHPHSADDDALVTAKLLIVLLKQLTALPIVTLQQMVAVGAELPQQTAELFDWALHETRKRHEALPDDLMVSNGIALRKNRVLSATDDHEYTFPRTKKSKLKLYPKHFEWRTDQAKMMNLIYRQYTVPKTQHQPLIIEAPTGTGKSLGYTLPLAYLARHEDRQVVIATDTVLLQSQLMSQTLPLLNNILPFHINAVVVKGKQHYLDLNRFLTSLKHPERSKQSQLIKLRLLVWLTQTTTGDLDELHFRNDLPYLDEVRHEGLETVTDQSPFYEDDFLHRLYARLPYAQFIIINHAFLVQYATYFGAHLNQPYLVVDEAQHLADYALRTNRQKFDFQVTLNVVRHQLDQLDPDNKYGLVTALHEAAFSRDFATMRAWLVEFDRQLTALSDYLLKTVQAQLGKFKQPYQEVALSAEDWQAFSEDHQGLFEQLNILAEKMKTLLTTISQRFESQAAKWLPSDNEHFSGFANNLMTAFDNWQQLVMIQQQPTQVSDGRGAYLYWVTVGQELDHVIMSSSLMSVKGFLSQQVYANFQAPIFTGATLFSSNRSQYLYDQLDLDRETVKVRRLKSDFNFEKQAKLYISKDAPDIKDDAAYTDYVVGSIRGLLRSANRPTLILFNSLDMIQRVYQQLVSGNNRVSRLLLAQGVSGGKEKLIKRFMDEDNAVLLGAASFWEGIDLPQEKLQLLVIARLPFDSPDRLETQVQFAQLKSEGKNPFYNLSLPKATLRLRQGIGRLIRTRSDYGAVVVLDSRLVNRQYGQTIMKTLPETLPILAADMPVITNDVSNFFKLHQTGHHKS